jgi:hypothetical protein
MNQVPALRNSSPLSPARRAALVAAGVALTVAMVYGIVFPLNGLTPDEGYDMGDTGQMVWNLWQASEAVQSGRSPFRTDLVYYPLGANLGAHTLSSGYVPFVLLVKLLTLGSAMYPVYALNLIVLCAYGAILMLTYVALREVGYGVLPSAIPAIGYAFCDFYYLHWLHLNHLAGFCLPLVAWLVVRVVKRPTLARALALAAAFAWSVYLTEFALSIGIAVLLFLVAASATRQSRAVVASTVRALGFWRLAAIALAFVLAVTPFLLSFFTANAEPPPQSDFSYLSANLAGFVIPDPSSTWLYGGLFGTVAGRVTAGLPGWETFCGFPMLLFAGIGIVSRKPVYLWFALATALVFYLLSLGPTLKVFEADTGVALPYALLMKVPPFDQNRSPVRFCVIGLFFVTFLVAQGLEQAAYLLRAAGHGRWAMPLLLVVLAWTTLEDYSRPAKEHRPFHAPLELRGLVKGPVVTVSFQDRACNDALYQVFHHQPIVGGCLARTTRAQRLSLERLRHAFGANLDDFERRLRRLGIRNVLVDEPLSAGQLTRLRQMNVNLVVLRSMRPPQTEEPAAP